MKHIVILGAGYASLSLIKNIPMDVLTNSKFTLISNTSKHYTSILLHEVVSGVRKDSVLFDLHEILPSSIEFIEDYINEIKADCVIGVNNNYKYDILIVGLGFNSDTFGIKGVKEFAHPIVNFDGAINLHNKVIEKLRMHDKDKFDIVVCGGGFSGIELISSLADEMPNLCKDSKLDSKDVELTCIEAMPNILPMFNEDLINSAVNYLSNLGVKLEIGAKILECKEDCVVVEKRSMNENIKADIIIWTAGVKGNEVIENSKFFTSYRSKVEINEYLQPINQENQDSMNNIFIIGDCAALKDPDTNRFYSSTAQMASQMGEYLANMLECKINNQVFKDKFNFISKGAICSLGNNYAIGNTFNKNLKGKIALYIKYCIEAKWRWKLNGFKGLFNGK